MASRIFHKIAAFWGYVSPRKPERRQPAHVRRRHAPPTSYTTPQPKERRWMPVTPVDTPAGAKRRREFEFEEQRKRRRFEDEEDDSDDDVPYAFSAADDKFGVFDSGGELEGHTLLHEEEEGYDSGDEIEDEEEEESDGFHDPRVWEKHDEFDNTALPEDEDEMDFGDEEVYSDGDEDGIIMAQGKEDGPGDEDEVIYADIEQDDIESVEAHSDDEGNATVLEHSVFEDIADGDDSILVDIRARVGSLDTDFVSKQFLLDRGWPEDSIWLIQRLHQRGHEPIFPSHWQMDFRFLPTGLFFPPSHPYPAHFRSLSDNNFRATKALTNLISMGPRVRDKVTVNKAPEPLILKCLRQYMHWATSDTNQPPTLPLITLHAATATTAVQTMQDELLHRLSQLYQHWHFASPSASPPTLYGILISHTLVGMVTFVPNNNILNDSKGYLRSVGVFDFGVADYDVWNALALALLVVHARDRVVERGNVGLEIGGGVSGEEGEDRDA